MSTGVLGSMGMGSSVTGRPGRSISGSGSRAVADRVPRRRPDNRLDLVGFAELPADEQTVPSRPALVSEQDACCDQSIGLVGVKGEQLLADLAGVLTGHRRGPQLGG